MQIKRMISDDDQKIKSSRGIGGRGSSSGGRGRGNTETTTRVISKIQSRVTAHGVTSFSSSSSSSLPSTTTAFRSHTKGDVYLHPSTIAFDESQLDSRYCCYHELVRTSKTYVRDCTTVSPFALLLFGGKLEVFPNTWCMVKISYRCKTCNVNKIPSWEDGTMTFSENCFP